MARLTLAQVAQATSSNLVGNLIEANTSFTPEWGVMPVKPMPGTTYQTLTRTSLPTVEFQHLGAGVTATKSTFAIKEHQMFFTKARVEAVQEIADKWDNSVKAPGTYFGIEASGVTRAAMQKFGSQMFYGTATGADKGFQGLKAFTPFGGTMTLDATGSTADTASSIYFVWADEDEEAACLLTGNDTVFTLPAPRLESISITNEDGTVGNADAYTSQMMGYAGLRIGSVNAVARICNVTAQTGKGCTDVLLAAALDLFPTGYRPTHIFMSRRSRTQLRISRSPSSITVINNGGASLSAPTPVEHEGIPIIATDSILNTDAIES